jgi:hypothetical protein
MAKNSALFRGGREWLRRDTSWKSQWIRYEKDSSPDSPEAFPPDYLADVGDLAGA